MSKFKCGPFVYTHNHFQCPPGISNHEEMMAYNFSKATKDFKNIARIAVTQAGVNRHFILLEMDECGESVVMLKNPSLYRYIKQYEVL